MNNLYEISADLLIILVNSNNFDRNIVLSIINNLNGAEFNDQIRLKIMTIQSILSIDEDLESLVPALLYSDDITIIYEFIEKLLSSGIEDYPQYFELLYLFLLFSPYEIKKHIKKEVNQNIDEKYEDIIFDDRFLEIFKEVE